MNQYLVISAMGADRTGLVDKLSQYILDHSGNICESHMAVLGGEFALIVLINGTPETIEKIQSGLPVLQDKLDLTIISKRTSKKAIEQKLVPYEVQVVSMDHPGIVKKVSDFFASRGINIEQLETSNYPAPHTGTIMFSLKMTIGVPADTSVGSLKRKFQDFCDQYNLDGEIEADR